MDKEAIISKIISEANKEAESIIDEAKAEIEKENRINLEKLGQYREKKLKEVEKQAKQIKENAISDAELKARNMILAQKQKTIKETKKIVNDKLNELDNEEYVNFIMKILENSKLIELKNAKIILPKKQREEIIKKLNGKFEISNEEAKFIGGFIIVKENIEYNYVLDTLLELEEEIYNEIILKELFN